MSPTKAQLDAVVAEAEEQAQALEARARDLRRAADTLCALMRGEMPTIPDTPIPAPARRANPPKPTRTAHGNATMLHTPEGEPVSRSRAVQLVLAMHGPSDTGKIHEELTRAFGEDGSRKCLQVHLSKMRRAGMLGRTDDKRWTLPSKKG